MDNSENTAMVALDLSAAFDTVNHEILIKVLENYFSIWDKVLNWIMSYLQKWQFNDYIDGTCSEKLQYTIQYQKRVYLVIYCLTATQVPSKKSCLIICQDMKMITL